MAFTVRKGIPLPGRKASTGSSKYNLSDLVEVGDSIFIPSPAKTAQVGISKAAKALGIAVATRNITEEVGGVMVKGLGVWRIEPPVKAAEAAAA